MTKTFFFEVDGGKTYQDGKSDYPSMIRIAIPVEHAIELIGQLAHQINPKKNSDESCEIVLFGLHEEIPQSVVMGGDAFYEEIRRRQDRDGESLFTVARSEDGTLMATFHDPGPIKEKAE